MQFLIIVLGLALVGAGLLFAVRGHGEGSAAGGARGFTIQGPAWLLVVAIGAGLVIFGAIGDFGDGGSGSTTTTGPAATTEVPETTVTTAGPATTTTTTTPPDVSGCRVTISNPLASIHEEPDTFSTEIMRVPPGTYEVDEIRTVTFVSEQRWFLITLRNGRQGWIRDATFEIASKSAECP